MHIHKVAFTHDKHLSVASVYMRIPLQCPSSFSSLICAHKSSELNIEVMNADISIEEHAHIHTASASFTSSEELTSKQHKVDQLQLNANAAHCTPRNVHRTPRTVHRARYTVHCTPTLTIHTRSTTNISSNDLINIINALKSLT